MRAKVALSIGSGAVVLLSAQAAFASGFATARFGSEHGHPTTDNPTALYYNPAGIAEDTPGFEKKFWRVKIFADANVALRWAGWTHSAHPTDDVETEGAEDANVGSANLFNVVTAPAFGASFQIENFALGAGFFVPLGGASRWDKNEDFLDNPDYAGPYDGVQRWHTIDGSLRSMYITVGAAYDILDRVSIGLTYNAIKSEVNTVRARNTDGGNDVANEARALIDVSGWDHSFGVGIIGEIDPDRLWIGFSYQAQPGLGEMKLDGTLSTNFRGTVTTQDVSLYQELPDIFRLGIRARPIKNVEMRFFGDVTNWSSFERQCIMAKDEECSVEADGSTTPGFEAPIVNLARDWGPAFGIRGGGSYWVVPEVEVFAGAGYDSNAVPDHTLEPALTDFHKASLAAGFRATFGEYFAGSLSYTHIFYVPRDTEGQSVLTDLVGASRSPDSGGRYTQTIGVINANVQTSF